MLTGDGEDWSVNSLKFSLKTDGISGFCCIFALAMDWKKVGSEGLRILFPLVLGGAILYWMYRESDIQQIKHVLMHEMDWTWMILSMPFGLLAQLMRGWRWRQTLEPTGEPCRQSTCVHAVMLSYAASLVVPRIGEFTRCGVLKRYDGASFSKALGTVVTERAIDSLLILIFTGLTLLWQMSMFGTFFEKTGTSLDTILHKFSATGYWVTALCGLVALMFLVWLVRKLSIYSKVKATVGGLWEGIISLKGVRNIPLFVFFSVGIWVSYFIHYYLTFFCFESTMHLGLSCAMVTFIVGSIAVIVPTPNGAGPWHFAVKTMLILYGVQEEPALSFVLIVHTLQTGLVVLSGVYAWIALSLTKVMRTKDAEEAAVAQEV